MKQVFVRLAAMMVVVGLGVGTAQAGWGWFGHGGSYGSYGGSFGGSWGSYGGSGGSYGGSWGSYGGSWGSYGGSWGSYGGGWGGYHRRGLFVRHHVRPIRTAYYGCGGSYGSYGSYGYRTYRYVRPVTYATLGCGCVGSCSCGCYDDCGCGTVGGSVMDGTIIEDGTVESPTVEDGAMTQGGCPGCVTSNDATIEQDAALLAVQVPAEADIFVNGYKTRSTGEFRSFLSSGLRSGQSYTYEVRAEANGHSQTKVVSVQTGQRAALAFDFAGEAGTETMLTLHVPEDATVTLAGTETKQTGATRKYSTSRLSPGQTWDDYVVSVTVQQNGQSVTKEQRISLAAGENHEMRIDFTDTAVAAR